jgi:diacylglycerol kinase (ATP)
MKNRNFSFFDRFKSSKYAWNGLKILIKEEHNAWIHLAGLSGAVLFSFYFRLTPLEWVAILLTVGNVFAFELINTSIENVADFISPDRHDQIKKIKDLSAGAVLVSVIIAILVGLIIFLPKFSTIF